MILTVLHVYVVRCRMVASDRNMMWTIHAACVVVMDSD